jgi:hypothetical protein
MSTDPELDLLLESEDDGHVSVALATFDFSVQWHHCPVAALRGMQAMLATPSWEPRELQLGMMFGMPLYLVVREGICSLKCFDLPSGDLFRIDLNDSVRTRLVDALEDAITPSDD